VSGAARLSPRRPRWRTIEREAAVARRPRAARRS